MRFSAPFYSCLKHAVRVMGSALFAIILVSLIADILTDVPPLKHLRRNPLESILVFSGLVLAFAVFTHVMLLFTPWSISTDGVVGRDSSWRTVRLRWAEISHVGIAHGVPFPAIMLYGVYDKKELIAYIMGLEIKQVHAALLKYAGADNPLAVAFRSEG